MFEPAVDGLDGSVAGEIVVEVGHDIVEPAFECAGQGQQLAWRVGWFGVDAVDELGHHAASPGAVPARVAFDDLLAGAPYDAQGGGQVDDDGHVSAAPRGVPPHVLVDPDRGDAVQARRVSRQMLGTLGRGRVVDAIPRTAQRRRHAPHAHRVQHERADSPPGRRLGQLPSLRGHA